MVRPSGAAVAYLPEPPGWRARPPGRLAATATDPRWSYAMSAPRAHAPRPLAIVEVVDYDLFALGTSRVLEVDPVGVLEERLGGEAVARVRRALRESRTYPTLAAASNALLSAIFGASAPGRWVFEAVVSPRVGASGTPWDARLLGHARKPATHGERQYELDTSPGLACCDVDLLHPLSCPPPDARGHWIVRLCQLTPLVRRGLSDREAEAALRRAMDKAPQRGGAPRLARARLRSTACPCRRAAARPTPAGGRGAGRAAARRRPSPRGATSRGRKGRPP